MNINQERHQRAEQALREAYRRQSLPAPGPDWYTTVMAQIGRESGAPLRPLPPMDLIAWRVAWAAAAAALLIAVGGFVAKPSDAQIVWDLRHLASSYEWSLAMGE